jgi:hypothetical protein
MPPKTIGTCHNCEATVVLDTQRDAALIPIYERFAKAGKLTCKPCAAKGVTGVDRDNPPDTSAPKPKREA